jgi:hypothetical protein
MSEYGPAFFIKRKNGQALSTEEQKVLLEQVASIAEALALKDPDGDSVEPEFYDYDNYEPKAVAFLLFYDSSWEHLPPDIQQDTEAETAEELRPIGQRLDAVFPGTYAYQCYYVEI